MAAGTGRTDNFYRLYGDVFGTENVTALDYSRFKNSLTVYNPMFDNYNTGNITALDYALFKKDLSIDYSGDGFVTTI